MPEADSSYVLAGLEGPHWGLFPAVLTLPLLAHHEGASLGTNLWVPWLAAIMASYDLAERRIPNPLNALCALMGLAWGLASGGPAGLLQACLGGLTGFALLAVFFFLGAVGAGDVKALAALATFLGPWGAVQLFLFTVLAGGVLALARLIQARQAMSLWGGLANLRIRAGGLEMPYGLAMAAGSLAMALSGGVQ